MMTIGKTKQKLHKMRKILSLLFSIFLSGTISAQQNIIDMEAFQSYMAELQDAEENNDKNKIAELQQKYPQYERKKIKKEAKTNQEACAYLAGYYEYDYRKKMKSKDLTKAANLYQIALYNRHDNPRFAQVAWSYACFLLKYREHHDELRRTKYSHTIVNKDYNRATGKDYILSYNQFKDRVYWELYSYINAAANNGYKPAQYARLRIFRCFDFPYYYNGKENTTSGSDILWQLSYSDEIKRRIHNAKETCTRNDRVVEYYKELATNGTPEIQLEFAHYLLQTRIFSWSSDAFELNGKPFYYKSSGVLDTYFNVVQDEFSDEDIEEMISYWFLKAAKQGNFYGMMNTAYCMYYQLAPYNDSLHVNEIIYWLNQATSGGEISAYYALSVICMNERFKEKKSYKIFENKKKAVEYAKKRE